MAIVTTKLKTCSVCRGETKQWIMKKIISETLAKDWQLTKYQRNKLDQRESSFCPFCQNSARTRALMTAIKKTVKLTNKTYIAEINKCGELHEFLLKLKRLSYSEYTDPNNFKLRLKNFLKEIRREDMTALSYPNQSFDLVLHSDVLEHIGDYKKAIAECRRVLKPSGVCLFTTPVIKSRKTKDRDGLSNSYHGSGESDNLVFWEFGGDFIEDNQIQTVYQDHGIEVYAIFPARSLPADI